MSRKKASVHRFRVQRFRVQRPEAGGRRSKIGDRLLVAILRTEPISPVGAGVIIEFNIPLIKT